MAEPWWNDSGRAKLMISPTELSDNRTSRVAKHDELAKGNDEFCLTKYLCSYFQGVFTCRKILRRGATTLLLH
jgi:hypothetical protein